MNNLSLGKIAYTFQNFLMKELFLFDHNIVHQMVCLW